MTTWVGWAFCICGLLVMLVAALGVLRLPDALSRQHAATKAATLAVILFCIGTALIVQDAAWTWRLAILVLLLMLTLPLASHALARAARRETARQERPPSSRPTTR